MKIVLRPGNINPSKRICFYCNCEFQFDEADVEYRPSDVDLRGTGMKPVKLVTCPCCGRSNILFNPNRPDKKYLEPKDTADLGQAYYITNDNTTSDSSDIQPE